MSGRVKQGQAPDGKDFANYFCTYAYLYHQVSAATQAPGKLQPCRLDQQ
jgi:hypothetical protein